MTKCAVTATWWRERFVIAILPAFIACEAIYFTMPKSACGFVVANCAGRRRCGEMRCGGDVVAKCCRHRGANEVIRHNVIDCHAVIKTARNDDVVVAATWQRNVL